MKWILFIILFCSVSHADYNLINPQAGVLFLPGDGKEIVFNDGGVLGGDSNFVFDKVNTRVGVGLTSPSSAIHIKSNSPGTVGSDAGGQVVIQALGTSINVNAIVTGYNSDGSGLPNQQLWYLGNSSSSNSTITFLNRISADLTLGTNNLTRMTIGGLGDVVISNFTKLGSDAPNIKMKKLTGTGGTAEGWTTNIAHGLGDISKIISATVMLTAPNGNLIPPSFTDVAEFQYDFLFTSTNAIVSATATNSGSILSSSAFVILLTLEK